MDGRLIGLLGCLAATSATAAPNLVVNSGFETDADQDGVPDGWAWSWQGTHSGDDAALVAAKQEPKVSFDEPRAEGGQRCLKVVVARPEDDGVWTQEGLVAVPDVAIYRVSAWLKTAGAKGGTAQVGLVYLGADNKWLGADYAALLVRDAGDWRHHTGYVKPPPGTQIIRLRLWTNMNRSGPITAWYDDLGVEPTNMKELPEPVHRDLREMPPLDAAIVERGFVGWASPFTKLIFADTKPTAEELAKPLTIVGVAGGQDVGTVAVRGLRPGTVHASITDLQGPGGTIAAGQIELRPARYLVRSLWARDQRPILSPRYLLPSGTPMALDGQSDGWLWVQVTSPATLPTGTYRGTLRLSSGGALQEIPVELRLYHVALAPLAGFKAGFYDNAKTYEGDTLVAKWTRQRQAGMTTVGYYGNFGGGLERQGGKVAVTMEGSELATAVAAHQQAGFTEPFFWLMGRDVEKFALEAGPLDSAAFATDYLAVVNAILDYGQEHGWPELLLQPVDEAFEHRDRFEALIRLMTLLRRIPGLKIEADGMNGNPAGLDEAMPLIDVFALHDGPFYRRGQYDPQQWDTFSKQVAAQHGETWFYNVDISGWRPEMGRFIYSWHPIRCGAKGVMTWSWQSVVQDPYAPEFIPRAAFMHEYPALGDEPGGPSPSLWAMREGLEDHRLWLTVQRKLDSGQGTPALKAAAQEVDAMLAKIDYQSWDSGPTQGRWTSEGVGDDGQPYFGGDLKAPTGWAHEDYDRVRELLLTALTE